MRVPFKGYNKGTTRVGILGIQGGAGEFSLGSATHGLTCSL